MKYIKKESDVLYIGDDVLIFDIETDGLDIETSKMKWFGAFSFRDNKYYFFTGEHTEDIQKLIDAHRVVVGYNSRDFDIPICENNGLKFDYKIKIDLMRVLFLPETRRSVREDIVRVDGKSLKRLLKNHKLKTVAETLKLSVMKGDIDYNIFKQDVYTKQQIQEILKYLHADVKITKELFEYLYKEFLPMKEFMSPTDQRKYNWFRTSLGSYTYKVICHHAGLEEEYDEHTGRKKYEGGFVAEPSKESYRNDIYCLDFNSAYPHAFLMGNLYSHDCKCCSDDEKWSGNKMFSVQGKYCTKQMGKIEEVIKKFYLQRLEYKKNNDSRQYAVKTIINTIYGISGSSVFKSLYSLNTASDCTLIARNMIKLARDKFEKAGYMLIYTDTDSVYVKDVFKDEQRLLKVKDEIINEIKANLPFPQITFDMGIDERMKAIWFFKDYNNNFKKKNYMYITQDDKIKIKGLPIIKSECSRVSKLVMSQLKPEIVERTNIKFPEDYVKNIVYDILKKDITLVANYYKVKAADTYKSQNCIQAQIANAYGEGEHWLVPNKVKGDVGKSKKYCTILEASELQLEDLDLKKIWDTELCVFINDWINPLFTRRMERAEESYQRKRDKEMQTFFESDLWDSDAVGADISNEDFLANEIDFEMQ
jgi:DNA polymerase elongation subunit (family B)